MTIVDAVKEVMRRYGGPMTAREALRSIVEYNLYEFNTENPLSVVTGQIRRHCQGIDFPSASDVKHFEIYEGRKYYLLRQPIRLPHSKDLACTSHEGKLSTLQELKVIHQRYTQEVRLSVLTQIRNLEPRTFETFAKRLLAAYGFHDLEVTRYSQDGGIDGFGKLRVGLANLNVAFQCKRYGKNAVGRVEIDRFRGAIQGQYEQGIFFTTSRFASGAESVSFRPGAVPIILIDGDSIVDLMIEKGFGVQVDMMPLYSYGLDLALADEEN